MYIYIYIYTYIYIYIYIYIGRRRRWSAPPGGAPDRIAVDTTSRITFLCLFLFYVYCFTTSRITTIMRIPEIIDT